MSQTVTENVFGLLEAARRLGVHPDSIRRAEREGRLPQARREQLSRMRLFTENDIELLSQLIGPKRPER